MWNRLAFDQTENRMNFQMVLNWNEMKWKPKLYIREKKQQQKQQPSFSWPVKWLCNGCNQSKYTQYEYFKNYSSLGSTGQNSHELLAGNPILFWWHEMKDAHRW